MTTAELPAVLADNSNANGQTSVAETEAAKQETRDLFGLQLQELTKEGAASWA